MLKTKHVVECLVAVALTGCRLFDSGSSELAGCLPEYAAIQETATAQLSAVNIDDAALVVRVDGQNVCRLFFGGIEPNTPVLTVSAAKWLTAATLMAVVDAGMLRLDTRASELYPSIPAATANITVSELLSHTSGLLWFSRCMGRVDDTLQRCAETILWSDLHFDPGTGFFYAGPPFTVAGAMAERATGKTWAELFRTSIVEPLGMYHTSYGAGANPTLSEGDVVSTADDYATFAQMILDNGVHEGARVLSENAIRQMRRNWTSGVQIVNSPRGDMPYALGAWVEQDVGGTATVLSSPGIGGFYPLVDFSRRLVVVFEAHDERVWPAIGPILASVRETVDRSR